SLIPPCSMPGPIPRYPTPRPFPSLSRPARSTARPRACANRWRNCATSASGTCFARPAFARLAPPRTSPRVAASASTSCPPSPTSLVAAGAVAGVLQPGPDAPVELAERQVLHGRHHGDGAAIDAMAVAAVVDRRHEMAVRVVPSAQQVAHFMQHDGGE